MTRRRYPLLALATGLLVAAACTATVTPEGGTTAAPGPSPSGPAATSPSDDERAPAPPPVHVAEPAVPDEGATVLGADDPVTAAVAVSGAAFGSAPVAVVAPADDVPAQLTAASHAVTLGAPLLLAGTTGGAAEDTTSDDDATAPGDGDRGAAVREEVERLGALAVLTVGDVDPAALPDDVTVVAAPDDVAALEELLRVDLTRTEVPRGEGLAAVAALDRQHPTVLVRASTEDAQPDAAARKEPDDARAADTGHTSARADTTFPPVLPAPGTPSSTGTGDPALPHTAPAEAPGATTLLLTGTPADLAPAATARAAGWDVVLVPDGDPRTTSRTVQALADAEPERTVAVGDAFGDADTLEWKVRTAATGVELPGGGQVLFPHRRMVALYGTPSTAALGLLGEQGLEESIARAKGLAAEYQALTDDPVVPAFEIIVTIASAGAGEDGQYSQRLPVESFVPWVEAARDAGVYVVLDLQPGRTDFLTQAKAYEELLRYPNVGLALDPEWRLKPDQVHLRQIGSVGVDEVNQVVHWLADLTREHALPQKLLVLHQFRLSMIDGRERLDTSRDELALMVHADGQGSQPAKQGTWRALHAGAPDVWWGWKNFIDEDVPMLTPPETYGQVDPVPHLVTYQ